MEFFLNISIELFEKYIGDIKDIEKDNSYKTRTHKRLYHQRIFRFIQ